MSIKSGFDAYLVYRFVRDLTVPFDKTKAYELGLIDKDGKRLKKASSKEEKEAITYYDRLIFNIKRLLSKFGMQSRLGTFAAAMFLLREDQELECSEEEMLQYIQENARIIKEREIKTYKELSEEIVNTTGSNVAGTGDDPVHWVDNRKKKGRPKVINRYINGVSYLKRTAREAFKRQQEENK